MWPVLRAPLAIIVLHSALSLAFGHDHTLDPWFHFLGGAAGAVALWEAWAIFPALMRRVRLRRWVFVLAAMLTVTLLWEVMELLSDEFLGTHVQRGLADTGSDIALGNLGAVVAVAYYVSRSRAARAGSKGRISPG